MDKKNGLQATGQQVVKSSKRVILPGGALAPLRVRDYSLLFSGQLISIIGDAFYSVALPWFMLSGGGGAQALGFLLTAYGVPRAGCILLGGPLSDRLRPRRLMLLSDIMRALLMGIFALLVLAGHPQFWLLCVLAALLGGFTGFFTPAAWSITPDLLSDVDLQAGNALTTGMTQTALMIGSSIAGFVVSRFQSGVAFLIDAFSFVVSAITLAIMRGARGGSTTAGSTISTATEAAISSESGTEMAETASSPMTFWQLLRSSRFLQILLVMVIFMNFGNGGTVEVALPVFTHDILRASASGYGIIVAAFSVGAIVGALVAGSLGKLRHRWAAELTFFFMEAALFADIPFLRSVIAVSCVMAIAGLMNGLGNVFAITMMQQVLPRHLLGRIMAALAFANFGFYPLSAAVGGLVVSHFGPTIMFLAWGVLIGGPCIFGLFQRQFWDL
jgi:MFS family permease